MIFTRSSHPVVSTLNKCEQDPIFLSSIETLAQWISIVNEQGKLSLIFGNGGSAADAQHWASELTCIYSNRSREPIGALALTTDTSAITAWSNDFEYESIFVRQVNSLKNVVGLAIGLSTSGSSKNVLYALDAAKSHGARTVLICGSCGTMFKGLDLMIKVPSTSTATIQTVTQIVYHSICEYLEPA